MMYVSLRNRQMIAGMVTSALPTERDLFTAAIQNTPNQML